MTTARLYISPQCVGTRSHSFTRFFLCVLHRSVSEVRVCMVRSGKHTHVCDIGERLWEQISIFTRCSQPEPSPTPMSSLLAMTPWDHPEWLRCSPWDGCSLLWLSGHWVHKPVFSLPFPSPHCTVGCRNPMEAEQSRTLFSHQMK